MSRYFFDVHDGFIAYDHEGVEFETLAAAKKEAIQTAGAMLSEKDDLWTGGPWTMVVRDESDRPVVTLVFRVS